MWNIEKFERRFFALMVLIGIAMIVIAARLWYLQIIRGDYYTELAKNNMIRIVDIKPIRGNIYDSSGRVLAFNRPVFALIADVENQRKIKEITEKIGYISALLELDKQRLLKRFKRGIRYGRKRVIIKENLNISQVARIKAFLGSNTDVYVTVIPKRFYPLGKLFAHEVGYVGRITQKQLRRLGEKGYKGNDWIGQAGIERVYESYLRGKVGKKEIEVDAKGNLIKVIKEIPPIRGDSLITSIDTNLQKTAYEALGDYSGVVIAMDPNNGSIMAMVSKPSFDPNMFVWGFSAKEWKRLTTQLSHPFDNRAIQSVYPPGSTFKILMALIVLHTKVIPPSKKIFCSGTFNIGKYVWKDWKLGGHGWIDLKNAIIHSCDVYFYNAGYKIGVKTIDKYAKLCGFGSKTGIDLPGEHKGILPTPSWKKKVFHQIWFPGDTVNLSIGQGFLLVTPIQMAVFISAVANDGYLLQPHIVKYIKEPNKSVLRIKRKVIRKLPFTRQEIEFVKRAMQGVVEKGTGQRCKIEGVNVAAKTGTAQNPHGKDHAWFVAFAPVKNPKIVVVTLVEHGGHGGEIAATISKKIIEEDMKRWKEK